MKHIIGSFSHLSPLSFQLFPSLSFNLLLALSWFSIHCPPFHFLRSAPCSFPFPFSPQFLPLPFQFYLYYPSLQPLSTLSFPFPVIYFPSFFLSLSSVLSISSHFCSPFLPFLVQGWRWVQPCCHFSTNWVLLLTFSSCNILKLRMVVNMTGWIVQYKRNNTLTFESMFQQTFTATSCASATSHNMYSHATPCSWIAFAVADKLSSWRPQITI